MDIKLLNAMQTKQFCFYNPKISVIKFGISLVTESMQIEIQKATDPSRSGKIEKGENVYDFQNATYFSMGPLECAHIAKNITDLMKGVYQNPDTKIPEDLKGAITINHFKDKNLSRLIIERAKDDKGNFKGNVKLTLMPSKADKGVICSYFFRDNELKSFVEFVKHCAYDLPYHRQLMCGIIKYIKKSSFDSAEKDKENKSGTGEKKPWVDYKKKNAEPVAESPSYDNDDSDYSSDIEGGEDDFAF